MRAPDLRKPRRDRIAREAEEAAARLKRWEEGGAASIARGHAFRQRVKQMVHDYFDFRNGYHYPCEGRLVDLLDIVRIEFFELQKSLGVGGQGEGDYMVPDDPRFGTQGNRQPLGPDEQEAAKAFKEGRGPKPHFFMTYPEDAPQDK